MHRMMVQRKIIICSEFLTTLHWIFWTKFNGQHDRVSAVLQISPVLCIAGSVKAARGSPSITLSCETSERWFTICFSSNFRSKVHPLHESVLFLSGSSSLHNTAFVIDQICLIQSQLEPKKVAWANEVLAPSKDALYTERNRIIFLKPKVKRIVQREVHTNYRILLRLSPYSTQIASSIKASLCDWLMIADEWRFSLNADPSGQETQPGAHLR